MQKKLGDHVFFKPALVGERKAPMRKSVSFEDEYLNNELTALCVTNAI